MTVAYIGVGSNLGCREGMLRKALERLKANRFLWVTKLSPVYETEPVGYLPQSRFLNAVWELETDLPPWALFQDLAQIERYLGKERGRKNGPRTIDLDLLAYDGFMMNHHELTIPHPKLHQRFFVLKPFSDINPTWIHPKFHKSIRDLLTNLANNL